MGWNHRILAHKHKGKVYLSLHEVFYDKKGKPDGYTENPITVVGEDLKSIKWTLKKMKQCSKKPILWAGKKFPKKFKNKI